jgi:hypothetical protein
LYSTPISKGVVQGVSQAVRDKAQRIQEVTLAGAVRSNEKHHRSKFDIARANTLVVLQLNARQESGIGHLTAIVIINDCDTLPYGSHEFT